jgi:hypothetical protein
MGHLKADVERGQLVVFADTRLLSHMGLPVESRETVAAHEILHFWLGMCGFPATRSPYPVLPDSGEAAVGSALQCLFQHVLIKEILMTLGFNVEETNKARNKMQLEIRQRAAEKGEPHEPGSPNFAIDVTIFMELQLTADKADWEAFKSLCEQTNPLIVSYGYRCLKAVSELNLKKPEGHVYAMQFARDILGLKPYVVIVDGRTGQES